jgi:hypothetical protein
MPGGGVLELSRMDRHTSQRSLNGRSSRRRKCPRHPTDADQPETAAHVTIEFIKGAAGVPDTLAIGGQFGDFRATRVAP